MPGKTVAVFCLGIWLACCGGGETPEPAYASEAESGRTVALAVAQELFVTLSSNASTGYSWSYQSTPDGVLSAVGEAEYLPDQPVLPGSGGRERFRFRAVRAGRTTVELEYRQQWDAASAAAETATYSVVVR